MALFAIQLVRLVLALIPVQPFLDIAEDFVIVINQMLNVIIIRSSFLLFLFYW